MEINWYPVIVPITLANWDYWLRFNWNSYKLVSLDEVANGKPVDLDQMVMDKIKEDSAYLKRMNMKVVASKRKKE